MLGWVRIERKGEKKEAERDIVSLCVLVCVCVCPRVCMCVSVHVHVGHCVCVDAYMHLCVIHASRGQRLTWCLPRSTFVKWGLSLIRNSQIRSGLLASKALGIHLPLSPQDLD